MNTLTLASIHAEQGYIKEAISILKELLKEEPGNIEARRKLNQLLNKREKFEGVDEVMRDWFVVMDSKEEFLEFERWLAKPWN